MKATGMVREVDGMGRFVIPKEIRKTLDIENGSSLEIYTDGDRIVLKKHAPACIFCGEIDDITAYKGKLVCKHCISALAEM